VSGRGQSEINGLELDTQQNQIRIDFLRVGFAPGEVLRYQYMMEGTNLEWGVPSAERTVEFASLQPGGYRFLVRAVRPDGTTSAPATVAFTIAPARVPMVVLGTGDPGNRRCRTFSLPIPDLEGEHRLAGF
jgi:hypothetical protein